MEHYRKFIERENKLVSRQRKNHVVLHFHNTQMPAPPLCSIKKQRFRRRYQLQQGFSMYRPNAVAREFKFPAAFCYGDDTETVKPATINKKTTSRLRKQKTIQQQCGNQMTLNYILN
mmetsp:Transcript_20175/g.22439  ORF Transcript_20175/g.22439 Transcript_20175/m.22439 type:complete len:117 (+) Transcript_20175:45-395(+)